MSQISAVLPRPRGAQPPVSIPRNEGQATQDRFMRIQEVSAVCGLSRSSIYARVKEKTFPTQIAISKNCVGWLASDINNWMQARIASRTH